ncbi:ATP-binding protein, partial [Thermogemmatispora sp.]|uniref:AAA family ATPase n=1 Tax=Thermogemmatispora sp. TaxID=1968838 RepID=UPI00261E9588
MAASSYHGTACEADGLTLLAKHLLPALRGEAPIHPYVSESGQLVYEQLVAYLRACSPECLQITTVTKPLDKPVILATFPDLSLAARQARQQAERQAAQEQLLRALADHAFSRSFLRDRLERFVGRERELRELRARITAMRETGGYLAITGVAGQGKSSLIAKLVDLYRATSEKERDRQVISHFIPVTPGSGYQVILLRHLMASLVLKYQLPPFYVESDQLPVLRDLFRPLLEEVVQRGGEEIIFIDGLDQLPEEASGLRDLQLLAAGDPPAGVVFVLGTRPEALRSLHLHKPFQEYPLSSLSLEDFTRLVQRRQQERTEPAPPLDAALIKEVYDQLAANALFLDLAARELIEHRDMPPEAIIRRLAANPENVFSLTMDRLGRASAAPETHWQRVIQPVLGALLTAREPLARTHLKQILNLKHRRDGRPPIDGQELDAGLERLKGLLLTDIQDGLKCYSLFHVKLHDYLRRDERQPDKDWIFDADDEQEWHGILATWCEQAPLDRIWQEVREDASERRRCLYARQHYVRHLYQAGQSRWRDLFAVLDEGSYGKQKVRFDGSSRLYAQDLELGQQAAASGRWSDDEAVQLLPHLWRYTLLRASLASKADRYWPETFQLMLRLGQERKALGLAELLTDAANKARVFLLMATHWLALPERASEAQQLLRRAREIALTIEDRGKRGEALVALAEALERAQRVEEARGVWEQAERVIEAIEDRGKRG